MFDSARPAASSLLVHAHLGVDPIGDLVARHAQRLGISVMRVSLAPPSGALDEVRALSTLADRLLSATPGRADSRRIAYIGVGEAAEAALWAAAEAGEAVEVVVAVAGRYARVSRLRTITAETLLVAPARDRELLLASKRARRALRSARVRKVDVYSDGLAEADAARLGTWLSSRLGPTRTAPRRVARVCAQATVGPAALLALMPLAGSSSAAAACDSRFGDGVLDIACTGDDLRALISAGRNGEILVNGQPVDGATTENTQLVRIVTDAGDDLVVIDDSSGQFSHGIGGHKVEIDVDFREGLDRLEYVSGAKDDRIEVLSAPDGLDLGGDAQVDIATVGVDLIRVFAGDGDDIVSGKESGRPLHLDGGAGNDVLVGGFKDDVIVPGLGLDTALGGDGTDSILEVSGTHQKVRLSDTLLITDESQDQLSGFEASELKAAPDGSHLDASEFDGKVTLLGGAGDDLLLGGLKASVIDGGDGDDTVASKVRTVAGSMKWSNIELKRSAESSSYLAVRGEVVDEFKQIEAAELIGDGDANVLDASEFDGKVTLLGGAGDDTLLGGLKASVIDGGDGVDTVSWKMRPAGGLKYGNIELKRGADSSYLAQRGDVVDGFKDIEAAELIGDGDANVLDASEFDGKVTLLGGAGDDTLLGGLKASVIDGGDGTDTIARKVGGLRKTPDITLKRGYLLRGEATDEFASIEEAELIGDGDANVLDASEFDGKVTLLGGAGDDTLLGGAGSDVVDGETGYDWIKLAAPGDVTLTQTTAVGAGTDVISGIEAADIRLLGVAGHKLDSTLFSGQTLVTGGLGDDTILTGAGNDVVTPGIGSDFVSTGAGFDTLSDAADLNLAVYKSSLTIGLDRDTFSGVDHIKFAGGASPNVLDARHSELPVTLSGGGGADAIDGGYANDLLSGGDGDDRIEGRQGDDVLRGGLGKDWLNGGPGEDDVQGGEDADFCVGDRGATDC